MLPSRPQFHALCNSVPCPCGLLPVGHCLCLQTLPWAITIYVFYAHPVNSMWPPSTDFFAKTDDSCTASLNPPMAQGGTERYYAHFIYEETNGDMEWPDPEGMERWLGAPSLGRHTQLSPHTGLAPHPLPPTLVRGTVLHLPALLCLQTRGQTGFGRKGAVRQQRHSCDSCHPTAGAHAWWHRPRSLPGWP